MTPLNIDTSFDQFIQFGGIGNPEDRKKIVEFIIEKLSSESIEMPQTEDKQVIAFISAISDILTNKKLIEISVSNDQLIKEIALDLLKWIRSIHIKMNRENPFLDEEALLIDNEALPTNFMVEKFNLICDAICKIYQRSDFDVDFYKSKINDPDFIKRDFHRTWEEKLNDKKQKFETETINKSKEIYKREFIEKIDNYLRIKQLLIPFTADMEFLWNVSAGVWQKKGFNAVSKFAQILEKEKQLQELADVLGRFRIAEKDIEEEALKNIIIKPRWKIQNAVRSELVGITESDDISSMLAAETALLSEPMTQSIFFKKFAEKKLLTFEFQSHFLDNKRLNNLDKLKKEFEKGPFIICVDTSCSMLGEPEYIAKTICFAILKIALEEKRKCYLISFSTKIETIDLTNLPDSLDKLVEFLEMSFYGGSDATAAIKHAIKLTGKPDFKNADVLIISDFIFPAFDHHTKNCIELAKKEKTIFLSLTISANGKQNQISQFDYNWICDLRSHNAISEITQHIINYKKQENKKNKNTDIENQKNQLVDFSYEI